MGFQGKWGWARTVIVSLTLTQSVRVLWLSLMGDVAGSALQCHILLSIWQFACTSIREAEPFCDFLGWVSLSFVSWSFWSS